MQSSSPAKPRAVFPIKHRYSFDAMMMFLYTAVVYVWGLTVYPMGRDYTFLESPGKLPFLAGRLFRWEIAAFGANPLGYHLVNTALLYACMVCIYHFTRLVLKGPVWYGTLAATLFMANPVHSESMLNLSGVGDLLPCLAALLALTLYAASRRDEKGTALRTLLPWGAFALAMLPYPEHAGLPFVLVLFEWLVMGKEKRRWAVWAPYLVVTAAAWYGHAHAFRIADFNPAQKMVPLYFIFYPLGFLPETAAAFHESPWLGWVAAGAVASLLALIYRKARRPVILFGLLGMAAVRLFQADHAVDPVHLIGGGQLLLANVLFNVAAAALFCCMTDRPKWRQPVILWTTVLCLALFGLQIRSNEAWRYAGRQVRTFQQELVALANEAPGPLIGLTPDYQYYRGAPLCLGEAVTHGTAFSRPLPVVSLLPLHYAPPEVLKVAIAEWTPERAVVHVAGKRPLDVMCAPYARARPGSVQETPLTRIQIDRVDPNGIVVSIRPKSGRLPARTFPVIH